MKMLLFLNNEMVRVRIWKKALKISRNYLASFLERWKESHKKSQSEVSIP
jgi:hypothetical protein